jgi:hypothetical protein
VIAAIPNAHQKLCAKAGASAAPTGPTGTGYGVARMLDSGPPAEEDDNFERGLRWLLDGFADELG